MQALMYHGREDLRLAEVPEPTPGPGQVTVRVHWCGICGTDLHEYAQGPITLPTPGNPHPLTGGTIPLIMGHECAGEVAAVGAGVEGFAVGDHVAVEPLLVCRECHACLSGAYNMCVSFGALGCSGGGGAYASHVNVDHDFVHHLPPGVTTEQAAVAEPICVGWHAVNRATPSTTDRALVIGAGPVGLGTLLSLRARGVEWIAVAEYGESARSRMAIELGADLLLDTSRPDALERLLDATGGQGADLVFEVAGVQASLDFAFAGLKHGGTLVSVCIWEELPRVDMNLLVQKEVNFLGSQAYAHEYPEVLAAIADGRIPRPERIVTKRVSLDDALEGGILELLAHKADHIKILVQP